MLLYTQETPPCCNTVSAISCACCKLEYSSTRHTRRIHSRCIARVSDKPALAEIMTTRAEDRHHSGCLVTCRSPHLEELKRASKSHWQR